MPVIDFLRRYDEEIQLPETVPSSLIEGANCIEPGQKPGLHIAGSRAQQRVALDSHWALRCSPERKDGIRVAKKHDFARAGAFPNRKNVVASDVLFQALYLEPKLGKLILKPILHLVDPALVIAPGVDAGQIAQIVDVRPDLRFEPAHDGFSHECILCSLPPGELRDGFIGNRAIQHICNRPIENVPRLALWLLARSPAAA